MYDAGVQFKPWITCFLAFWLLVCCLPWLWRTSSAESRNIKYLWGRALAQIRPQLPLFPLYPLAVHSQLKRLNQATVDLMAFSRSIQIQSPSSSASGFPNHLLHSLITCNLHSITIAMESLKTGNPRNAECNSWNALRFLKRIFWCGCQAEEDLSAPLTHKSHGASFIVIKYFSPCSNLN